MFVVFEFKFIIIKKKEKKLRQCKDEMD